MLKEGFTLCLVGGGLNALYLLERILARKLAEPESLSGLVVHIFDQNGHFGSGCHYSTQPKTNHLNRIASQISFAADPTNGEEVGHLLPDELQWTLFDWCERKFRLTGEERFKISEHSWVDRALFGEAAEEVFRLYLARLAELGIDCRLHIAEVFDVARGGPAYRVHARQGERAFEVAANFVVLCTGHGETRDNHSLPDGSGQAGRARLVEHIYPLETIDARTVPNGAEVGCKGLGLAAIDLMLWLTEGRGGYFSTSESDPLLQIYHPSGFEPERIVPFSGSGAFPMTRARNQKLNDDRLLHKSIFLTYEAIDRLREVAGQDALIPNVGAKGQIDFEAHILPIMITEMALVHYKVLFGQAWLDEAVAATAPVVEDYLRTSAGRTRLTEGLDHLFAPVDRRARETAASIAALIEGRPAGALPGIAEAAVQFTAVVQGKIAAEGLSRALGTPDFRTQLVAALDQPSPWRHSSDPTEHMFDWWYLVDPLAAFDTLAPEERCAAALDFLHRDLKQAQQGNLDNPTKSAIDGVCRDIRDVLRYAVEFGGLTAQSQTVFATTYQRLLNRLAVGTSLKIMKKIHALAAHGVVDLSYSRSPRISAPDADGWTLSGRGDGEAGCRVQVMLDARVHLFNVETSKSALYANLLARRLVRRWRNPDPAGNDFEAGGLDIVPKRHLVVTADGTINQSMAALGVPTEGALYFHLAAQRPFCSDPIVVDAENVLREVMREKGEAPAPSDRVPAPAYAC